jgi:hypothetical protein
MLIGGLGALVAMVKGLLLFPLLVTLELVRVFNTPPGTGYQPSPYMNIMLGSEGATLICGMLGMVGVGLAVAGRLRTGTLLMVLSAVGVAGAVAAYAYLIPVVTRPMAEYLGESAVRMYPTAVYYVWLAPVPLLLVATALTFFARRTE